MFPLQPVDLALYKQRTVSCYALQPNFGSVGCNSVVRFTINDRIKGKFEEFHHIFLFLSLVPTKLPLMEKTQSLFIKNNNEGHNCNGLVREICLNSY